MKKEEFLRSTERVIYQEIAIQLNSIVAGSKTAQAAFGLFLNVPIRVELRKLPEVPKPKKSMYSLTSNLSAYLKHDNSTEMFFTFFYSNEKQLKMLHKSVTKNYTLITYLYLRELLRLTRGHQTLAHYKKMSKVIAKYNTSLSKVEYLHYITAASHYEVNLPIRELFYNAGIKKPINEVLELQRFNEFYKDKVDIEVMADVVNTYSPIIEPVDSLEGFVFVDDDLVKITDFELVNDEYDAHIVDIGETIEDGLREASKGCASAEIFGAVFAAKKTKTGWFKKIKKAFQRRVYYATNDFSSSWSSLNNIYRHKFKSPNKTFTNSSIEIFLSLDHSGSMNEEDMAKLLYIIKENSKKISKVTVLVHDTEVVKEFILESDTDITEDPQFQEALGKRYACGGTSHYCIFDYIDKADIPDPSKVIYISLSDNYSDIPQSWAKFPKMQKIATFLVSPIDNPVNGLKGDVTNITME